MADDALNIEFNKVMNMILANASVAAYAGLQCTRIFVVKTIFINSILDVLESMDIAYAYLISKDVSRLSVFTTGIEIDRPFDDNQI